MAENKDLIDPVSLETFTYPIILPCGHTFDQKSVISLKEDKCPTCQKTFSGDKERFPINWSLVGILNLDIKIKEEKESNDISSFDAAKAKANTKKILEGWKNDAMLKILLEIDNYSKLGASQLKFSKNEINYRVHSQIIIELRARGFKVDNEANYFYISWD